MVTRTSNSVLQEVQIYCKCKKPKDNKMKEVRPSDKVMVASVRIRDELFLRLGRTVMKYGSIFDFKIMINLRFQETFMSNDRWIIS